MSDTAALHPSGAAEAAAQSPLIRWDTGTAYDFFISLQVLHDPDTYGLRASWAAGVRSRLPAPERKVLEDTHGFLWVPTHWISSLPEPKDAATALWELRQLPPVQRITSLLTACSKPDIKEIIDRIFERGAWVKADLDELSNILSQHHDKESPDMLSRFLDWCAKPAIFGDLLLSALQSYYQSFFAEEEKRIQPYLKSGLVNAQALAEKLPLPELLAELSQGLHFEKPFAEPGIVLVPGYWNTPLVFFGEMDPQHQVYIFGVRPPEVSIVPGEMVPDGLLRSLKALADPTRLRILHFLSQEAMTQAELARRLRLRAPTITHHLSAMRLAGLVHINIDDSDTKENRLYAARLEAVQATFKHLEEYLRAGNEG